MKNPIRLRTDSHSGQHFDIYLYDDKSIFESDVDELMHQDVTDILFSGATHDLLEQKGQIKEGTHVSFFEEGMRVTKFGVVVEKFSTPYLLINEDKTNNHYAVHIKYVKSIQPTFSDLAKMYINKIKEHNYRKYDLGVIKLQGKTFMTAEESLADLANKARYIIMTATNY
jgi:hypothetical protein